MNMTKIIKKENFQNEIKNIPSLSQDTFQNIMKGLYQGKPLLGKDGLFSNLLKEFTQIALQAEMDSHLAENAIEEPGNRRNGITRKNMQSSLGSFELETPRDRNSSFQPQLIKKRQTILTEELDQKIISLFALGNSYNDITNHLQDIYGVEISNATISAITDRLLPELNAWRTRPLDSLYTIVFLDAMHFKTKQDHKVEAKVIYNVLGITKSGHKEILGFYSSESEGAHFWLGVLNDLKNRGVEDILIACIDGLKGFPEAINASFPKTEIQLCVVHQIRNSIKYVSSKDQKEFISDLKFVYKAENKDSAEFHLLQLDEKWGKKYPMIIRSWNENWSNLSTYFKYSSEIRTLIYTTNPIEGFHRQVRKYTKTKGAFPNENSLFKILFCAINQIAKKWTMPISNWGMTISQLDIFFPGRINFNG